VLLVDDLLMAPMKGILWVFEEIHKAANEAQDARREQIMAALSELYVSLEQGAITEDAFDDREQALLDELDTLDARAAARAAEEEEDDADADAGSIRTVGSPATTAAPGPSTKKELAS
jgi:hypothetical protein